MKTKFLLLMMCFGAFLVSCTNSELDGLSKNGLDEPIETGEVSFLYKGLNYSCSFQRFNDEVIFSDENVGEIVDVLKSKVNLVTCIHIDGSLEYFDNQEDFKKNSNGESSSSGTTRRFIGGTLILYEKDNYKGDKWSMSIRNNEAIENPNVGKGWNDRISSFKLTCDFDSYIPPYPTPVRGCGVTFYEHENYGGASLVGYSASTDGPLFIPRIKDTPLYPGSGDNWNDRITSFKFCIM